jgi:5'-nucleotidase
MRRWHSWRVVTGVVLAGLLAACSSSAKVATTSSSTTATTAAAASTTAASTVVTTAATTSTTTSAGGLQLNVLVTNDDGVSAPGIDALVEALRQVPGLSITVVAPSTNQSGTGGKTTSGDIDVIDVKTPSGYPAKSVDGTPADGIVWAIDHKGLPIRPDVVISGSNFGQNLGFVNMLSGTLGAARFAGARGIPAVAVSQGLNTKVTADFASGVKAFVGWFTANEAKIVAGKSTPATVWSFNAPSCVTGSLRGVIETTPLMSAEGRNAALMDCTSTKTAITDDIDAFNNGYASVTIVPASQVLEAK